MTHVLASAGNAALRLGRFSEEGRAYLVTTVTCGRAPVFASFSEALAMARLLANPATWQGCELLAWVLMPDHLHALIVVDGLTLSRVVALMKGRTAFGFNRCTGQHGSLWQRAFHDRAIRRNESMRDTVRYVVANPVRAGLAGEIGEYPFWDCAFADGVDWLR